MQTDDIRAGQPAQAEAQDLKIGELVEVRPVEEILATLDERGRLEALPFMPEMLQFAGKQLQVSKRAFKTCEARSSTAACTAWSGPCTLRACAATAAPMGAARPGA